MYWDARETPDTLVETFSGEVVRALGTVAAATYERELTVGTLAKYQLALVIAGRPQFEQGMNPYQDVKLLTRIRNSLVHFEPE